jgi:hypothetical protein
MFEFSSGCVVSPPVSMIAILTPEEPSAFALNTPLPLVDWLYALRGSVPAANAR